MSTFAACRFLLPAVLLGLIVAVGCGPSDEIRKYEVPKPDSKSGSAPESPDGPVKSRLMGAVIPAGDGQSWFVKFSGPIEAITAHEKAVSEFIRSVRVTNGKPTWTAPPGWKEGPPKMMRVVTFVPPGSGKPPELYVSDPFSGTLLANVNRWRKEVGLKDVTEAELPTVTTEVKLGDVTAHMMDFRGPGGTSGMPPFMGK